MDSYNTQSDFTLQARGYGVTHINSVFSVFVCLFDTRSHCVPQAGHKLVTVPSQAPECWDRKCVALMSGSQLAPVIAR